MSSADSFSAPPLSTSRSYEASEPPATTGPNRAATQPAKSQALVTEATSADAAVNRSIDDALAELMAGDFNSQWGKAKQFSKQFAQWGDRAVPALIHCLKTTEDLDNQWFLVRLLSQFDQAEVVTTLAQLLVTTPDETLQAETVKALTCQGKKAISVLTQILNQPGQTLANRHLAARALARIRRSGTIAPLLSIATDPDPVLRAIAIEALGSFHDPRITPVLLVALDDEPAICIEAVRALGRRKDLLDATDLVTPLARCLNQDAMEGGDHCQAPEDKVESQSVAKESAIALGRLGTEAAAIALSQALQAALPSPVKMAAARALGWIESPTAIDGLAQAFALEAPMLMPEVKQAIAQALGQTPVAALKLRAAAPLIRWLTNAYRPNGPVAVAAPETSQLTQIVITALTQLRHPDAIDGLVACAGDTDMRIQMHALSALQQIDRQLAQKELTRYLARPDIPALVRTQITEHLSTW